METHLEKIRNKVFALETNLAVAINRINKGFPQEKILEVLEAMKSSINKIKELASEKDSGETKLSFSLKKLASLLENPPQKYSYGDIVWARVRDCPYQLKIEGTDYFNTQIDQWVYLLTPATEEIWQQIRSDGNAPRFGFGKGIISLREHQLFESLDDAAHAFTDVEHGIGAFDKCFKKRKERKASVRWFSPNLAEEREEIIRQAKELNLDQKQLWDAFQDAKLISLDNITWDRMQNTDSNDPNLTLDEIKSWSDKDVESILNALQTGKSLPAPMVLIYKGIPICVAGNTRLSISKILEVQPKVLMAII